MVGIEDLKEVSKLWCDNIKHVSEDTVYYISSDIILHNLYFEHEKYNRSQTYYKDINKSFKVFGWDIKYPAEITIGEIGEIFLSGGNHRMNLLREGLSLSIPFKFKYRTNIKEKIPVFLETGENFYPNGLLPKWK